MVRAPSFAGVILAAGDSSRMGRDKALLPWPPVLSRQPSSNDTFLSAAIRSLFSTDIVLVVAGQNQPALAPVAYANGASIVVNPDPGRGQFSSLQVGLQEVLNRGRDAAIIALVDRPPVSSKTIGALRKAFESAPDPVWAVVPEFGGKSGHPIVIGRELIEVLLQAPPDSIATDIERQYEDRIERVAVSDPFVSRSISTPEDYAALLAAPSLT
jgi:molybdenum cofactor cytidylyltransferase